MRSKRRLALLLVPMCIGLAACGGDDEVPETQVIVPETTPQSATEDPYALPSADGYMVAATQRQIALRTAEGDAVFHVDPADRDALGIGHMQSHAGAGIGFRIYYEERDGKYFAKAAEEIAPPF